MDEVILSRVALILSIIALIVSVLRGYGLL